MFRDKGLGGGGKGGEPQACVGDVSDSLAGYELWRRQFWFSFPLGRCPWTPWQAVIGANVDGFSMHRGLC